MGGENRKENGSANLILVVLIVIVIVICIIILIPNINRKIEDAGIAGTVNRIAENEEQKLELAREFNSQFTPYEGESVNGFQVKELLRAVDLNNSTNNKKVLVQGLDHGLEENNLSEKYAHDILSTKTYSVKLVYDFDNLYVQFIYISSIYL